MAAALVLCVILLFVISSTAYMLDPETVYEVLRQDADALETEIETLKQEFNVIKRRVKDSKEQNRILQKKVEDDLKVLIQKPKVFDNKLIKKIVDLERFVKRKFAKQRKQIKTLEARVRKLETPIPETDDTHTLSGDHGNNGSSTQAQPANHRGDGSPGQDLPGHHRGDSSPGQPQPGHQRGDNSSAHDLSGHHRGDSSPGQHLPVHHGYENNSTQGQTRQRSSRWRKAIVDLV